ncbi:MAG: nucleoside 2-deoxyribosyltransferase domain-containing protein [Chitinophagales bacterium]
MQIITASEPLVIPNANTSLFLAGSIEQGKAENWQDKVIRLLRESPQSDTITLLNPRRAAWDASWEQSIDNPQFKEQVSWELDALEQAKVILFYFDPSTKSPISLLELGLYANTDKTVLVCCPVGFWRKGNVDIVCERYGVQQFEGLEEMVEWFYSFPENNQEHLKQ